MNEKTYLTLVFDVTDMDLQEITELTHRRDVSYLAWGHVPYELKKQQLDVGADKARAAITKARGGK